MRNLLNATTIGIIALILPIAALANVTGTPTLASGQTLNLDTGAVGTSGGDLAWNGTSLTPQGSAGAVNVSTFLGTGASTFNSLTQFELSVFVGQYTSAAVSASSLGTGGILAVFTNGGNYAAVLVTAQSGTSISLQFTTFVTAPSGPAITQVLNNYSLIPSGFVNSGIAQGSLFIVKGSGLADPNAPAVIQSSTAAGGLPNILNGASVKVTVGSTTVVPVFYYAIAAQLALVLPSNTPLGAGTVTVTYNSQNSAPFAIQVVASAMGFLTYSQAGSGPGKTTSNSTGALFNFSTTIAPGTVVVLWGSGLGADSARDTAYVAPPFAINALAHVYVGGVDATIVYQGASGFPGLNQVDIIAPANAPTGCNVSVVGVTAAGVPTNFFTLPIAEGGAACSDPGLGTPGGGTLTTLNGQTTVNTGSVIVAQATTPQQNPASRKGSSSAQPRSAADTQTDDLVLANFESYTGSSYGSSSGESVSLGGCYVQQSPTGITGGGTSTAKGLDAGTLTVTGPVPPAITLTSEGGVSSLLAGLYEASTCQGSATPPTCLSAGFIPASGGTFAINGAGGKDVGPFNTQIIFPNPVLVWTNQNAAATITRANGLLFTWSGGAPGTIVYISGSSSASPSGSYTCIAPVAAGSFMVPSYVLAALPASTSGTTTVYNETMPQSLTATGLDYGASIGYVSFQVNSTYN